MASDLRRLSETASLEEALAIVREFNASGSHDGILVQSPLPEAMGGDAERRVFDMIDPAKDVDGFNPINVGRLVQNRPALAPCTPSGIIELLDREGVEIAGARAVVIGRSDIVGKPMAMLLLHRHATVTICHSKTVDLPAVAASCRYPGGGHRSGGVRDDGVREIGGDGCRRWDESSHQPRPGRAAVRGRFQEAGGFRQARVGRDRRRAAGGRMRRRGADTGSRGCWSLDDCDVAGKHDQGRRGAPRALAAQCLVNGRYLPVGFCEVASGLDRKVRSRYLVCRGRLRAAQQRKAGIRPLVRTDSSNPPWLPAIACSRSVLPELREPIARNGPAARAR